MGIFFIKQTVEQNDFMVFIFTLSFCVLFKTRKVYVKKVSKSKEMQVAKIILLFLVFDINKSFLNSQTEEVEEPLEEEEEKKEEATKDEDKEEDEEGKVEEEKDEDKPKTKKVSKTVWDWELMNSVKPIWTRK